MDPEADFADQDRQASHREWPPPAVTSVWVLPCPDLDAGLADFSDAGFTVHSLGPADDPTYAVVFRPHPELPAVVRLDTAAFAEGRRHPYLAVEGTDSVPTMASMPESEAVVMVDGAARPRAADAPNKPVFSDWTSEDWVVGRAGLRYRDLLPERWGGQFIASHIHIPTGGPVPDYVHFHDVDFQLIFCHRGWVGVVYEDQGEPFTLRPGDAILQAPGIRHRVLESSEDLYVVEISSPAEHPTFVEQHLDLPNGTYPGHQYGGQNYVHFVYEDAQPQTIGSTTVRSLDLEAATDGRYGAHVLELSGSSSTSLNLASPGLDSSDFVFLVVLDGALIVSTSNEQRELQVGQSVAFDPGTETLPVTWGAVPPTRALMVQRYRP